MAITHKDEIARFLRHKRAEKNIEGIEKVNKQKVNKLWKEGYREGQKFTTFRRKLVKEKGRSINGNESMDSLPGILTYRMPQ
ncbi:MAG: hypothetical protein NPIRA06_15290 [Nitrospirales bacterium]|nr:MAG: hypothetical protein NPIRA06_15290 [Nitrospirales bacterium]